MWILYVLYYILNVLWFLIFFYLIADRRHMNKKLIAVNKTDYEWKYAAPTLFISYIIASEIRNLSTKKKLSW